MFKNCILVYSGTSGSYFKIKKKTNNGEQEIESIIPCEGEDRKIRPSGSPYVITRQASWCQTVILGTDFSILPPHSW